MRLFDLHCDTITKLVEKKREFTDTKELHVNLPGLISSQTAAQVFACFVPGYNQTPDQVFDHCNILIDAIDALAEEHQDRLCLTPSLQQLETVMGSDDNTGIIIAIEGATPLKGDPDLLSHFYDRGVRLLTIAWDDNEFCGTVFGNGKGLTPKGRALIARCNELGVAIDVSHASDKAFFDIAAATKKPFSATHSNARAVCPNDRNLTDEMIKIIADRGGIIGLTYGSGFISPQYYHREKINREKILKGLRDGSITIKTAHQISHEALSHLERARLEDLARHVIHILDKGGEECLGLGSDFDGVDSLVEPVDGVSDVPRIFDFLHKQGILSRVLEKIACYNAMAFFKRVL